MCVTFIFVLCKALVEKPTVASVLCICFSLQAKDWIVLDQPYDSLAFHLDGASGGHDNCFVTSVLWSIKRFQLSFSAVALDPKANFIAGKLQAGACFLRLVPESI